MRYASSILLITVSSPPSSITLSTVSPCFFVGFVIFITVILPISRQQWARRPRRWLSVRCRISILALARIIVVIVLVTLVLVIAVITIPPLGFQVRRPDPEAEDEAHKRDCSEDAERQSFAFLILEFGGQRK